MLFFGNGNYITDNSIVYNLNSLREGYPRFKYLMPYNKLGFYDSRDFDLAYYNYLFENDNVFKEFFDIIFELYSGKDVFILVDQSMDWSENIAESLFKVIQQRYGYNAIQINSFDDYINFQNNSDIPQFNPTFGLYNLDIDKERYTSMIESARISYGGNLIYVE